MPNSRKDSKKHRGAWLEPAVIDRLREIAVAFDGGQKYRENAEDAVFTCGGFWYNVPVLRDG